MVDQYEVVNPTSLFMGRVGRKEATKIANEITLSFDSPRGKVLASFHPSEIKRVEKICWHCGHYAFGCFISGSVDFSKRSEDTCGKWCPEGTKGTVTDFNEGESDRTSWAENEWLQDDESNL